MKRAPARGQRPWAGARDSQGITHLHLHRARLRLIDSTESVAACRVPSFQPKPSPDVATHRSRVERPHRTG